MENTKKSAQFANLSGLLYREWVFIKKPFLYALITFAIVTALAVLVLASTKVGNLAKLPDAAMEISGNIIQTFVFLLPPFMTSILISASTEASALHDEQVMWRRFRCASPAKPAKFALAKSIMLMISLIAAIGLGFAYIAIVRAVNGERLSASDAGYLMTFYTLITAMFVLIQIFTMFFHSVEKATLVLLPVAVVIIFFGMIKIGLDNDMQSEQLQELLGKFQNLCIDFLPFAPLVLAAIIAIQFAALTVLIGKGEK
ncbi:MAG: ABC-2 transporter permease [Oscillospiraceae bacterium]